MRYIILAMLLATMLITVPAFADQQPQPQTALLLLDISDSPLSVVNKQFAQKAARWITEEVLNDLPLGSVVEIRTFGEYDLSLNSLTLSKKLLNRRGQRPQEVIPFITKLIAAIPDLVAKGKFKVQRETNIIGALKLVGQRHDPSRETTILILSDMLEWSPDADAYKLVTRKGASLPKAPADLLKGAKVIALGAGYGLRTSVQNDRLQEMWGKWFQQAGVNDFKYLTDF